jgi:hypothetical protein
MFCPCWTRRGFTFFHRGFGTMAINAISVSSGVRVRTTPRRFDIRWT